jgi:hypothetical protein
MVQQMAIYDQGCKAIVSVPFRVSNRNNLSVGPRSEDLSFPMTGT